MTMHRKDYELIAKVFKRARSLSEAVELLAPELARDNPAFNPDKFFTACRKGVTEEPRSLKPCPFCGGKNVHLNENYESFGIRMTSIWCGTCDASFTNTMATKEATISLWNSRQV